MGLLDEGYLRNLARIKINSTYNNTLNSTESIKESLLNESFENFSEADDYDIFLSHSYLDKEIIIGIKIELENLGYSVYVDWVVDSQLNRRKITSENVLLIKKRMKTSKCLMYATSENSSNSRWMPWELGFMDGFKGKVVILPVTLNKSSKAFKGVEYLSIYPYIDKVRQINNSHEVLWVNDQFNRNLYVQLKFWLKGESLAVHSV